MLKKIIFLLLLLLIGLFYWQEINHNEAHVDEMTYILRGKYLDLYLAGDFDNPLWQTFDSYEVPKLIEFFYGFSTRIFSGSSVSQPVGHPAFAYTEGRF